MSTTGVLTPRVVSDKGAATIDGFSISWHRNQRYEDERRIEEGLPAKGPKWIKVGRNVRYPVDELNTWLDSVLSGEHPAWETEFQSDTRGLKYSGGKSK